MSQHTTDEEEAKLVDSVETENGDENDDSNSIPVEFFARQFTIEEFERSRFDTTAKSLRDLLNSVLSDKHMKPTRRRRYLNDIRRQYPHIIQAKFGVMTERNWNHLVSTYCAKPRVRK